MIGSSVEDLDFSHIDNLVLKREKDETQRNSRLNSSLQRGSTNSQNIEEENLVDDPVQLPNGKWACKHKCGDKEKSISTYQLISGGEVTLTIYRCKHLCCRDGLDRPPKIQRKKSAFVQDGLPPSKTSLSAVSSSPQVGRPKDNSGSSSLEGSVKLPQMPKRLAGVKPKTYEIFKSLQKIDTEVIDLLQDSDQDRGNVGHKQLKKLNMLHSKSNSNASVSRLSSKPKFSYTSQEQPDLSLFAWRAESTELPSLSEIIHGSKKGGGLLFGSSDFEDDELDASMAMMKDPTLDSIPLLPNPESGECYEMDDSMPPTPEFKIPEASAKRKATVPFFVSSPDAPRELDSEDVMSSNYELWGDERSLLLRIACLY